MRRQTIPEVWKGDYTRVFLGCTAHVLRLVILFDLQRTDLDSSMVRVALWDGEDGEEDLESHREYDVVNAELKVRRPKLQTKLCSSELYELGQMIIYVPETQFPHLHNKDLSWERCGSCEGYRSTMLTAPKHSHFDSMPRNLGF